MACTSSRRPARSPGGLPPRLPPTLLGRPLAAGSLQSPRHQPRRRRPRRVGRQRRGLRGPRASTAGRCQAAPQRTAAPRDPARGGRRAQCSGSEYGAPSNNTARGAHLRLRRRSGGRLMRGGPVLARLQRCARRRVGETQPGRLWSLRPVDGRRGVQRECDGRRVHLALRRQK